LRHVFSAFYDKHVDERDKNPIAVS
jgi:hypothetical protein